MGRPSFGLFRLFFGTVAHFVGKAPAHDDAACDFYKGIDAKSHQRYGPGKDTGNNGNGSFEQVPCDCKNSQMKSATHQTQSIDHTFWPRGGVSSECLEPRFQRFPSGSCA